MLGSDYDSDDDRDDLIGKLTETRDVPQTCQPRRTKEFQDMEVQKTQLNDVLHEFSKPKARVEVAHRSEREVVQDWLRTSDVTTREAQKGSTQHASRATYRVQASFRSAGRTPALRRWTTA